MEGYDWRIQRPVCRYHDIKLNLVELVVCRLTHVFVEKRRMWILILGFDNIDE